MSKPITIETHWDTMGIITYRSNPVAEYELWRVQCTVDPEWTGGELTLADFEAYIADLVEQRNAEPADCYAYDMAD